MIEPERIDMKPKTIVVAACAPRTFNIGSRSANEATVRMLAGKETSQDMIVEHAERFLQHHIRLLHTAGEAGADVTVIPEDCLRLGPFIAKQGRTKRCGKAVEAVHDLFLERLGQVCCKYSMSVVAGTMTVRNGSYFNTAMMLDPAGEVIASYDKTHLPPGEAKFTTPGSDLPVFDTHLGRVGLLICWDIVFPEPFAVLAAKGADVIFEPTFGHWTESHDITARSRAMDWCVPLVVSMWGGCACIIDAGGKFVARSGQVGDTLAMGPLDLRKKKGWLFMKDVRAEKPKLRRPDLYAVLTGK